MRYAVVFFAILIGATVTLQAQTIVSDVLFDDVVNKLGNSVMDASHKQAMYSYDIANIQTPGFKPILTPEDEEFLRRTLPEDGMNTQVMMEHFMARLTENRSKHSAYVKLMMTKLGITRQVATLGKR